MDCRDPGADHGEMTDIRSLNERAVRSSMDIVRQATPTDLGRPGWTLADLLGHMTVQHRGFAAAAQGVGADLAIWEFETARADAVEQYLAASEQVIAAFATPEVLAGSFVLPELGDPAAPPKFPAKMAIGFHFIDYLVHGWDVARTLGIPYE